MIELWSKLIVDEIILLAKTLNPAGFFIS